MLFFCTSDHQRNLNDSTRHRGENKNAWEKIKEMEGEEVNCDHVKFGKMTWKIVESVEEDVFEEVREYELGLMEGKYNPVKGDEARKFDTGNYNDAFWLLWSDEIKDDVTKLNMYVKTINEKRKERFQRVIKDVTRPEFIIFHALLIGASVYSAQGVKLWNEDEYRRGRNGKRVRRGLSKRVNFGDYMKLWRFKQIKDIIPMIMEDKELEDIDDWWKLKTRVNSYIRSRKEIVYASHVLVFDESMSAFVPR